MAKSFRANTLQVTADAWVLNGSVDPTAGAGVQAPKNSIYYQTGTNVTWHKMSAFAGPDRDWVPLIMRDLFGDGTDGDIVIGAGTTTLAREMFYNNLTVQNTAILAAANFRIWVRDTLTIDVGGLLQSNGTTAPANLGIAAHTARCGMETGGASANSSNGAGGNGSNATMTFTGYNPSGGAGGAGNGGAGGNGGVATTVALPSTAAGQVRNVMAGMTGQHLRNPSHALQPGCGGGGGGGSGAAPGGGGGQGAGALIVNARNVVNNGAIECRGGGGGVGTVANSGGGGGGGGGVAVVTAHYRAGTAPDVTGGPGGASGGGAGVAGVIGSAGLYVPLAA